MKTSILVEIDIVIGILFFQTLTAVHQSMGNTLKITNQVTTYPPFTEQFTIIMPTHHTRSSLFTDQMDLIAYGQSKYLHSIYIYWIDKKNPMPSLSAFINLSRNHIPVYLIQSPTNTIIDRFIPPSNLSTQTILTMDDDLNVSAETIDTAFEVYLVNHFQNRIFGNTKRMCENGKYYAYRINDIQTYGLVLTGFAFLDVSMLNTISLPKYKELTDFVSKNMNCEDILMNFVVSHNYKTFPVAVKMKQFTISSSGISLKKTHGMTRNKCCRMFSDFFGYQVAQRYSTTKIQPLDPFSLY